MDDQGHGVRQRPLARNRAGPGQQPVTGFVGHGLVNTFTGGDAPQGTATSKKFRIERRYIGFLIGGGTCCGDGQHRAGLDKTRAGHPAFRHTSPKPKRGNCRPVEGPAVHAIEGFSYKPRLSDPGDHSGRRSPADRRAAGRGRIILALRRGCLGVGVACCGANRGVPLKASQRLVPGKLQQAVVVATADRAVPARRVGWLRNVRHGPLPERLRRTIFAVGPLPIGEPQQLNRSIACLIYVSSNPALRGCGAPHFAADFCLSTATVGLSIVDCGPIRAPDLIFNAAGLPGGYLRLQLHKVPTATSLLVPQRRLRRRCGTRSEERGRVTNADKLLVHDRSIPWTMTTPCRRISSTAR